MNESFDCFYFYIFNYFFFYLFLQIFFYNLYNFKLKFMDKNKKNIFSVRKIPKDNNIKERLRKKKNISYLDAPIIDIFGKKTRNKRKSSRINEKPKPMKIPIKVYFESDDKSNTTTGKNLDDKKKKIYKKIKKKYMMNVSSKKNEKNDEEKKSIINNNNSNKENKNSIDIGLKNNKHNKNNNSNNYNKKKINNDNNNNNNIDDNSFNIEINENKTSNSNLPLNFLYFKPFEKNNFEFIGNIEKDSPLRVVDVLQNNDDPRSLFIEIEWKKRANGIKPKNSTYSNKRIREKFPYFLLDFYEDSLFLSQKRHIELEEEIERKNK